MPIFAYKAARAGGGRAAGHIEAADETGALDALRRQGLIATELRAEAGPKAGRLRLRRAPTLALDVAERMAILLGSGIRLDRALQIMTETGSGQTAQLLRLVLDEVRRGKPLSAALATLPEVFDEEFVSMVAAGEGSGALAATLERLALLRRSRQEDATRLRSALTYPFFLLGVAALVLYLLAAVVLPRFRPFFEGSRREPPPELMIVFAIGDFVQAAAFPAMILVLAGLVAWVVAARHPAYRIRRDALMLRLPMIGPVLVQYQAARFATTLSAQVAHGVTIGEALKVASLVVGNTAVRAAAEHAAAAVVEGRALSAALDAEPVFPKLLVQLVRLGEETNQLADLLHRTGQVAEQSARRSVQQLERVLAPALTILVGGLVGAVILVVFHAVQSLYSLI